MLTDTGTARPEPKDPFIVCLNTATLRGHKLPLGQVVDIAAKAGYRAIEPWIDELDTHAKSGASLKDLAKRIRDHGMTVESAIGFFDWLSDDDAQRAKGLEEARHAMDLVPQVGGKRIAAPPVGATDRIDMPLSLIAERYRAVLELGDKMGVVPQAEIWGFSKTLGHLGEAVGAAIESGHPNACILPDIFHLYRAGTDLAEIRLLGPETMHVFHVNDWPAQPAREKANDGDRVYPGDGIGPVVKLIADLRHIGFRGALSLELFNHAYYAQDPLVVAKTGAEKIREVVRKSATAG